MKKKIYLSAIFAIFLFSATFAQIEKNDWLLGGTLGLNTSNSSSNSVPIGNSSSNANFSPHIAYALGKNSVIGLNLGYSYTDNSGNYKSSSFSLNIFYKKYLPCREKFGLYFQFNGGTILYKLTQTIDSAGTLIKSSSTSHVYDADIIPGVYYQASKRVLINADCGGISYAYYDYGAGSSSSYFSFNFLSNFTFGVDFILGKK